MNTPPLASAGRLLRSLVQKPGGTGLAIAAVTLPLIFLLPDVAALIVLAALLIYPLLDAPRTLGGKSWWRAALIAVSVWFVVFVGLIAAVDSVRPLRDDAMVYLAPFMLYPLALALAGFVRIEGRINARPAESGPRTAAKVIGVTCALLLVFPLVSGMIPLLQEKFTRNTPANTSYSNDGEVVSATSDRVDVRFGDGKVEPIRFGPETKFDFWGPGSPLVEGVAGAAWLRPGQRLNVGYVYRDHEARADDIHVWIERKGCAGDEKWLAAGTATASPPESTQSLTGTTWEGTIAVRNGPEPVRTTVFELMAEHQAAYQDRGGGRQTDAQWRQNGAAVIIEINDCYAKYEGTVAGNDINGEFSNEMGARTPWTAHRK
jgi:hypothetical protein